MLHLVDENYPEALKIFNTLLSAQPGNTNLNFLIGLCYLKSPNSRKEAIGYFEKAVTGTTPNYSEGDYKQEKAPIYVFRYLAEAYHLSDQFEMSIETYKIYKTMIKPNQAETLYEIDRQIQICENALGTLKKPINVKISNIGGEINSEYAEYAPLISADESTIIFTSRRKGTGNLIASDGKYFEDIYISESVNGEWSEPRSIGESVNTDDHESATFLSADGQMLLLYKYKNKSGDIYISRLSGNTWSVPEKLNANINSPGQEPHACLSNDEKLLFFSSNRPGGFGGKDIYFSKKLPDKDWALPINCGPFVNTPYDEDFPYLHPDGKTLYFSSNGHSTIGGYDIFTSTRQNDSIFSPPENYGFPVNTTGDDFFFTPTSDGKRAYISSFRKDGFGEQDIYLISFPEEKEKKLTVYKGVFKDVFGNVPDEALISVVNNSNGEMVGKYKPNSATGKYILILAEDGDYNITYSAKDRLFSSDNLVVPENSSYQEISSHQELKPVIAGSTTVLRNIFFDENKSNLKKESMTELKEIFKLLAEKKELKAEISGHTDAKGNDEYNLKLSQQRAQEVVNFLVKNGVGANRLKAIGYGKLQPVSPNVKPDGSDNPEGRAKNRRTELKLLAAE